MNQRISFKEFEECIKKDAGTVIWEACKTFVGLWIICFLMLVCGTDPLNMQYDESTSGTYKEDGKEIIISIDDAYSEFRKIEAQSSLITEQFANDKIEQKRIKFEGSGEIMDVVKLEYNYSFIIKRKNLLGKVDSILVRVPIDRMEYDIDAFSKGDVVNFSGMFHYFKDEWMSFHREYQDSLDGEFSDQKSIVLKWGSVEHAN